MKIMKNALKAIIVVVCLAIYFIVATITLIVAINIEDYNNPWIIGVACFLGAAIVLTMILWNIYDMLKKTNKKGDE